MNQHQADAIAARVMRLVDDVERMLDHCNAQDALAAIGITMNAILLTFDATERADIARSWCKILLHNVATGIAIERQAPTDTRH